VGQFVKSDPPAEQSAQKRQFVEVFAQRLSQLKRIVAGMGFGPADGVDILQEVYLTTLKQPSSGLGAEEKARWLIRVTVNRCILEFRRRKRFQRHASVIAQRFSHDKNPPSRPDQDVIRVEQLTAVRQALRQLDSSLQGPLILKYFCDLDARQISEILELNHSTVRSRLRKARMILAQRLLAQGIEP
jgi:RNA polymerase sigma-70 factor, ECF subfamily